ncbi:MAG: hypothetical protein ABSB26_09465 [Nitrososphaerales archaeon]
MGRRIPAAKVALAALGSLMLEAADRLMALTLGAWLNIGGLVLLVVGNPALEPLQVAKSTLKNYTMSSGDSALAVKQRIHPSIVLTRVTSGYR